MSRYFLKKVAVLGSALVLTLVSNPYLQAEKIQAKDNQADAEKSAEVIYDESIPEDALEQQAALDAHKILMQSPGFHDSVQNPSYPSDFGGCYIGDDDKLHVQYIGDSREKYAAIFPSLEAVVLEKVDYSYTELSALADSAFSDIEGAVEAGVDVLSNQASVGVEAGSKMAEQWLSQKGKLQVYSSAPVRAE